MTGGFVRWLEAGVSPHSPWIKTGAVYGVLLIEILAYGEGFSARNLFPPAINRSTNVPYFIYARGVCSSPNWCSSSKTFVLEFFRLLGYYAA